jgi:hypothetical protein
MYHPDEAFADTFFEIYKALFKSSLKLYSKQRCLEWAADGNHTWRIVGISVAALKELCANGSAAGLKRAHSLDRSLRARHIFERDDPLPKPDMLDYFFSHDTTTLVTAAENRKDGTLHWSRVLPVPEGILSTASFSVYASKKHDLPWAEQQLAKLDV